MPECCRAGMHLLGLVAAAALLRPAASRGISTGLVVTSRQMIGTDYKSQRSCDSEVMRGLNGKLYSDFRVSGHGAVWEISSVFLSVDMQSQLFDPVDTKTPIGLRLSLGFVPNKFKSSIHVVKVGNDALKGPKGAPAPKSTHCGIPKPGCYGQKHCYSMSPPFGWSSLPSVKQPSATVLDLNITTVVNSDDFTVQVWAVPDEVSEHARWETPTYTILNWRFFNFDSDGSAGMDDEYSDSSGSSSNSDSDDYGGFSGSDQEDSGGADAGEPSGGPASPDADEGADEEPAEGGGASDWWDLGAGP